MWKLNFWQSSYWSKLCFQLIYFKIGVLSYTYGIMILCYVSIIPIKLLIWLCLIMSIYFQVRYSNQDRTHLLILRVCFSIAEAMYRETNMQKMSHTSLFIHTRTHTMFTLNLLNNKLTSDCYAHNTVSIIYINHQLSTECISSCSSKAWLGSPNVYWCQWKYYQHGGIYIKERAKNLLLQPAIRKKIKARQTIT